MFIAKPRVSNFIDSKTFETAKEAVKYLNDINVADEENKDWFIPKLKFEDWALIGKILKVNSDGSYSYIEV